MCLVGDSGENSKNEAEAIFKKTMANHFPEPMTDIISHIYEA